MWTTSTRQPDGERLARGRARRYAWAVGAASLARVAPPLLSLLITPYALSKLGAERYGLFALALTMSGWLMLLDPGLAPGLRIVLARRSRRLESAELAPLLGAAAGGQRVLALIVALGGAALAWLAPPLLGIQGELQAEARSLLLCIAGGTAVFVIGRHYAAALDACQLIAVERAVRLGQSLLRLGTLALLLSLGWGLRAAGWSYAIAACAAVVALWVACRRLLPELRWRVSESSRASLLELLRPGLWLSLGAAAGVMIMGLDRAVVARILSLEAVTVYALTGAVFLLAEGLLAPMVDAARPALAQALGRGSRDEARQIYVQLANGAAVLAPAAALGLFAGNRAFVTAWAGAESYGGWALDAWFGLAVVLNIWTLPHRALLSADLRAREATLWRLGEGALNLALSVALAVWFGIAGVAAGTVCAGLLTSCWALPRLASASAGLGVRATLRPILGGFALLVALAPLAALARAVAAAGGFAAAAAAALAVSGAALALGWKTALSETSRRSWITRLREGRRAWSAA